MTGMYLEPRGGHDTNPFVAEDKPFAATYYAVASGVHFPLDQQLLRAVYPEEPRPCRCLYCGSKHESLKCPNCGAPS